VSPLLLHRLSDEQLGSRLASGEAAAFDELYRRYVHRLSAYGANLLGDAVSGDDVAQSALLKAYGALRDGRVPDRVRPWLYRIAHNVAIDLVTRRLELPSAELPEGSTGTGEPVARSGALVAALAALPDRQRRVYVLRELHGLRIDETAAELGLSSAQVEQSLFVARNRLAEHLVFGDRLNCVAVQRLALGPLERDERRALKTHLRSCSSCRTALGLRGRVQTLFPLAPFDWLRGLFVGVATGGAPAAAKVGAVVVTATLAAGVSGAADQASHHARPVQRAVAPIAHARRASVSLRRVPARSPAAADASLVTARLRGEPEPHVLDHRGKPRRGRGSQVVGTVERHDGGGGGSEGPSGQTTGGPTKTQGSDGGGGSSGGSGRSGPGDGGQTSTVPVTVPTTPATTAEGGGEGPSHATTTTEAAPMTPTSGSGDSRDGGAGDGVSGGGSSGGDGGGGGNMHDSGSGDDSAHG
jgi:RNA polymerase sigma-70 factor (ECF subfamily)